MIFLRDNFPNYDTAIHATFIDVVYKNVVSGGRHQLYPLLYDCRFDTAMMGNIESESYYHKLLANRY